jgi:opacity protein-like surface antigen
MNGSMVKNVIATSAFAALFFLGAAGQASAQAYISPFIGYDFGGDSGCPEVSDCENKHRNLGVSFGSIGSVFGSELEFSYIDNFFGETPGTSSSVLTLMGNFMLAPKFGVVQPYGVIGLGLIKTRAEITVGGLLESSNNQFGWDIGGGVIGYFGDHFGVRGDLRYFHAFQDLEIFDLPILDGNKLDFGRLSGGVVFKF